MVAAPALASADSRRKDRLTPDSPIDDVSVRVPGEADAAGLDQDEEFCEVEIDGRLERIRFHEYERIYGVPGLYERLFSEMLECRSPEVVVGLLAEQLERDGVDPAGLRVLDFGAGNGLVGEELRRIGAGSVVGVDLLPGAKAAAERDRPGVYDDYRAVDMTALTGEDRQALEQADFNCVTCVAALGFGDVPPEAFVTALDLVSSPAWVAFNIRERYTAEEDTSGFAGLLTGMLGEGALAERARRSYPHRLALSGEPLTYVAVVAEKDRDRAIR